MISYSVENRTTFTGRDRYRSLRHWGGTLEGCCGCVISFCLPFVVVVSSKPLREQFCPVIHPQPWPAVAVPAAQSNRANQSWAGSSKVISQSKHVLSVNRLPLAFCCIDEKLTNLPIRKVLSFKRGRNPKVPNNTFWLLHCAFFCVGLIFRQVVSLWHYKCHLES